MNLLPPITNRLADRLTVGLCACELDAARPAAGFEPFLAATLADVPGNVRAAGVASTRALYHALGLDPTKNRPSSEALLRRVTAGKGFPRVHPLVDLTNLLSLLHQVSFGLYDLERIAGRVEIRLGAAGEGYPGIRKEWVNLEGRIILADEVGPFGNPTSDSLRTCVEGEPRRVLQVLFLEPGCPWGKESLAETASRMREFFPVRAVETAFA